MAKVLDTTTHEAQHPTSTRIYWVIGAILAVVTAAEVSVTFIGLEKLIEIVILLILSVAKGSLIVMFFMHLRGDAGIFKFVFIAPFILAVSMGIFFLVLFGGHVGIAG